jgi:hypothetical protein
MGLPRSGIDSQVEATPFKQEGFKNSGALAEEIKETGILVYQKKQFGPPSLDHLHPRLLASSLHCGPSEAKAGIRNRKRKSNKIFHEQFQNI